MSNEAAASQPVESVYAEALGHLGEVVKLARSLTDDQFSRLVQHAKAHLEASETIEQLMLLSWLRCELSHPSRKAA
ncbi:MULTISPECIES: hypothetical protein [Rhizobium]|uniref:hypothetical protein n=1 Tax=Rhizobium TaxID=379 RepID=UPI001B325857|nr:MULTISPECIES: hypothetical protein [Rhizobium]MBX4911245.1 hypothetical protein [Rhizobium bangladeshense]MBX5260361.1 hypothetical protein [Rhizobium sp. NLR16b]MBX5266451.1 hypothetical protein [Rhizobium sp. NLR16a]MBX5276113.1 hypothetical protein [Rhizobium sp. NLR13a]MBX5315019.1 hypothetical protein [Rhizobium sp. NLR11b]